MDNTHEFNKVVAKITEKDSKIKLAAYTNHEFFKDRQATPNEVRAIEYLYAEQVVKKVKENAVANLAS